jgi:hypothetical protein
MAFNTTKGMSLAAFKKLRITFPYQRPKVLDPIEVVQRKEGMEDVMSYIERNMVDDTK